MVFQRRGEGAKGEIRLGDLEDLRNHLSGDFVVSSSFLQLKGL